MRKNNRDRGLSSTEYARSVAVLSVLLILTTCDLFKTGLGDKVDITPPVVDATSLSNGSYVHGAVTLQGSATDDTGVKKVTVLVNSGSTLLATIPATISGGTWSALVDTAAIVPNQEVQIDLTIRATDKSGKISDRKLVLYFDNVNPVITSMVPSKANLEKVDTFLSQIVAFDGSVKDGLGVASLSFVAGGTSFPLAVGSNPTAWRVVLDTTQFVAGTGGVLPMGGSVLKVPLVVQATDNAGNASAPINTFFFVDQNAAAPQVTLNKFDPTITWPAPDPVHHSNVFAPGERMSARITSPTGLDTSTIVMKVTGPAGAPLVYSVANGNLTVDKIREDGPSLLSADVSAVLPALGALPAGLGEYKFEITASDLASQKLSGVVDTRRLPDPLLPTPHYISLMVNDGVPATVITSPINGAFLQDLALSGTIDAGLGPLAVEAAVDGGAPAAAPLVTVTPTQSTWSYSLAGLSEGPHSVAVQGFDITGAKNEPPITLQFTVDRTRPTVSVQTASPAVAGAQRPNAFADVTAPAAPGGVVDTVNGIARFKGTATDETALKTVAWKIQHASSITPWTLDALPVASGTFTSAGMSLWTLDVDTTAAPYVNGDSYVLTLTATDQAGNLSDPAVSGVRAFTVDQSTDAPVFSLVNMTAAAVDSSTARLNLLVNKIQLDAGVSDDDHIDGSTLSIYIDKPDTTGAADDTVIGTQNPDGSLAFSYSFATTSAGHGKALSEGRHWFHLKVSDDASWKDGKPLASSVIGPVWFAIDTAQPQISFDQTGTIYVSSSQALSGTVSSGNALDGTSPFTLTYTGVTAHAPDSLATPAATGSHAWSYVLNVGSIADGPLSVVAKAKDEFGLESQQSFVVTVDKAPPDTLTATNTGVIFTEISTLLIGMVGDTTSGISSLTAVVKKGAVVQAMPPVTVSAQAGVPSPTGSNWSLDTTSLGTGDYTLTLTATDKAGNSTVSSAMPFRVDKDLPSIAVTLPADGAIYNAAFGGTGVASGTASDTYLSKVQYRIDGGSWTDAAGTSSWSFPTGWALLAEGPHTVSVTAYDQGGHTVSQTVTFTKDTIAPTASYGNISGGGGSVLNETVSALTGTINEATTFIASGNVIFDKGTGSESTSALVIPPGQRFFAWSQDITALPEGTHTVTVETADTAANDNTATALTVSFIVDRSPPTAAISPLSGGQYKPAGFAVAGTAGDAVSGLKNVVLTVDSTPLTVTGTTSWTANVTGATFTSLSEGPHTLTATSTDNAGHSAAATASFIKDTVAPTTTFGNIVAGNNTLLNESVNALTGTVSDPSSGIASMQIKLDGGALQSLGAPAGANSQGWSWDISALSDGTHTVEVQAVDQAGNAGTTGAVSFRVDRQPPVVVITTPAANGIFSTGFGAPAGTASGTAAHVFLTTVQYRVDGGALSATTGTASWTASLAWAALGEGQHTITVQATDAAAHVTAVSVTFRKDSTPPAASYTNLTTSTPWSVYQQPGTRISGSLSDTNGVATAQYLMEQYGAGSWTVTQALTSLGATGNATSFPWNVDLTGYADGHYRITIQSTDVATPANTLVSGPYEFYVDTAPPTATIGVIVNNSIVSANPGTPSGTGSDANLTALSVQLDANAPQNDLGTAPAWSYAGWSWAALADGHHTLTVTATDIAARTTTVTAGFTKDTTAPAASYTNLATTTPWTIYQQAGMKISGSLSDTNGIATAQYHVEQFVAGSWVVKQSLTSLGATGNATSFPWIVDLSTYTDGHYRISIQSSDVAAPANTLANGPYEFYVDTVAPAVSLTRPTGGLIVAADFGAPTGSATDANLTTASVQLDSNGPVDVLATAAAWTYAPWSWAGITDGQHSLTLTATDVAGRTTTTSVTFIKDTAAPTVSYNNLAATGPMTVLQSPNVVLSGILSDANGVASGTFTIQKWNYGTLAWDPVAGATTTSLGATSNAKNFSWSVDLGSSGLNITDGTHDGKYRLSMTAQDITATPNLLDTSPAPIQFMISLSNPAASVTTPGPGLYENGAFPVTGTAADANGITSVLVKVGSGSVSFASGTSAALATIPVTLNLAADTFTTPSAHGLVAGTIVVFTGSTLPSTSGGTISSATPYYVIAAGLTATTFEVSTVPAGAAVDFTGNGSAMAVGSTVIPFGTSASWMVPSLSTGAFPDGSLTAFVQVTAGSGRVTVTSRDFTLDMAAPAISVTSPVSGSRTVGNLTINGTSTDPGTSPSGMAAVAQYQIGKNANLGNPASWTNATGGAYSWSMNLGLMNSYSNSTYATECDTSGNPASGTNLWKLPIFFQALDKAGNQAQVLTYYLILDPNGNVPVVLVTQPTQSGATFGGMVRISGTATQPIWIHDVEVAIDPAGGGNFPASPVGLAIAGSTITATAHPFTNGMMVFLGGTTAPQIGGSNVSAATAYFVVNRAVNTFQVSATSGGAPVTFSSGGSAVTATTWAAATLTTQGNSVSWYYDVNQNSIYPQSGTAQGISVQVRAWNSPTPGGARGTISGTLTVPLTMNFNATFPHFINMKVGPDSNPANGVGYFSQITVARQFYVLGSVTTSKGLSRLERLESSPLSGASTIYDFATNGSSAAVTSSAPYSSTTVTPPASVSAGSFPTDGTSRILITAVGSVSDWSSIGGPNPASVGTAFVPTGNGAALTGATAMVSNVSGDFSYSVAMSVDSVQLYNNTTGVYSFDFRATDLTAGSPQVSSTTITLNEDNYYPSSTLTSSSSIAGSQFKIQGSATDVGAGFGSIQGLRKVVVYLEKGGQIVDFTGGSAVAPVTISAKDMNNAGIVGSVAYPPVEKTGGSFTSGHKYEILTLGSTDFTAAGASANVVGTIFTATNIGGGSGTAVDLTLTAKYSPYIDNKGEVGSGDTNQDGFVESFLINGNSMDWWAQFDSTALSDGSVNIHYVIFDNAGNATHYQQSAYVSNHAPSINTVVLGTDLNGDGSITGAAPNETLTFNNGFLTTGFTARNRLLSFQINTIYGGQNGALSYSLKNNGNEYWGAPGTTVVGNTLTINFSAISPAIADATGNSALFVLKVTDATPGGGQSATVTVGMNIQNVDTVAPTLTVAPFGQRYNVPVDAGNGGVVTDTGKALGAVGAYTDNVATSGPTLLGHVEYAADSIYADAQPNLSGQVLFRGKAFDNQRINRITATIPGFNGGTGVGAEFPIATWGGSGLSGLSGTGWSFASDAGSEGVSQADGHVLNWALTWDSSLITTVAIRNLTATFKVYDFMTSGTGATRGSTTTLTSAQLVGMTIANGTPVFIGPTNPTWTTVTAFNSGTGLLTFATAVPTAGNGSYTLANVTTSSLTVDVVPYVTKVATLLSNAYSSNTSAVNRSATGYYPVRENESVVLTGFNFNGTSTVVSLNGTAIVPSAGSTTSITLPIGAVATSGALAISVNAVNAANNANRDIITGTATRGSTTTLTYASLIGMPGSAVPTGTVVYVGNLNPTWTTATAFDNTTGTVTLAAAVPTGNTTFILYTHPWDLQPNNLNNNNLDDDLNFYVWRFNAVVATTSARFPRMRVSTDAAQRVGFSYDSGAQEVHVNDNGADAKVDGSFTQWYDTGFAYDGTGHYYAIGVNGDSGGGGSGSFNATANTGFYAAAPGSQTADGNGGTYTRGTNKALIESAWNGAVFNSDRIHEPRIATSGAGPYNIFMTYWDDSQSQLKFRYGTVTVTGVGPNYTSTFGGNIGDQPNAGTGSFAGFQVVADTGANTYKAGEFSAVGITSGGVAVVAWYDATNRSLVYSYNTSPTTASAAQWQTNATVIDSNFAGWYVDLAVDAADGIHIAYYNASNGDLKYAYLPAYNQAGSAKVVTVDSWLSTGSRISLAVKSKLINATTYYVPYISFFMGAYTATSYSTRVAWRTDADMVAGQAAPSDGATSDVFTGRWEVMTVPSNNVPKDYTVGIGFKTLGAATNSPIVGYATNAGLETAILK